MRRSRDGRHPVDRKYVYNGLEPFLKAEAAGILTDEGRKVIAAYRRLDSLSTGEYGILCPLGSAEHKGIATRMATRFPSVFEGRDSVFAISTYKQRCIMSAAYFMSALTAKHPRLRVGLAAGDNNKMYVQHCGSAVQGGLEDPCDGYSGDRYPDQG